MAGRRYVYILEVHIPYEGALFLGCFSTWRKAEIEKNRLHMEKRTLYTMLIRKQVIQ